MYNTEMQTIEITEVDMEDKTERLTERIISMPTETIEAPFEAPTSPVNEESDNEYQSFVNECHGENWRHTIEVLDAKVKKPQF